MNINHILVPTDFLSAYGNALGYAIEPAFITGAKITLLNVYFIVDPELSDKNIN